LDDEVEEISDEREDGPSLMQGVTSNKPKEKKDERKRGLDKRIK
jgi:hypothetical protein